MKMAFLLASLLSFSPAIAQTPPQPHYVPLDENLQNQFLQGLADISMPAKAYKQIMDMYQQLEQYAQQQERAAQKPAEKPAEPQK